MRSFAKLSPMGRVAAAVGISLAVWSASTQGALAQQPSAQTFISEPGEVLKQYPNGGPSLISLLREYAIAEPKSLQPMIQLLANANKDQKTAIGSALAQAAKIVVKTNQTYAGDILRAIAESKDQDVILAYNGVVPQDPTGATGGGGAGAGGGSGGQTNTTSGTPTSTGGAQAIGGGSTPTGTFSYTPSVSGTGTTTGSSNTTTFLTTSVSP